MKWYWYVSRPNELFLDLDNQRAVLFALEKLERNNPDYLAVRDRYLYESGTPGHYHLIVRVYGSMPAMERAIWELYLGSDIRRQEYVMMRLQRGLDGLPLTSADFLITPEPYGFRKPDLECDCEGKHKEKRITDDCPVMQVLLEDQRSAVYFALKGTMKLQLGKLPPMKGKK
jgi:hypothetical protein